MTSFQPHSLGPPDRLGSVGVFSTGIRRIPHLRSFLGADRIVLAPSRVVRRVDAVVGWGKKPNTARPRRFAQRTGKPFVALEDGFLRSVELGGSGEPPLSMVVDDLGIYYDATAPSRLERFLDARPEGDPLDDPELLDRARRCMARIQEHRLSKYNAAPVLDLGPKARPRVLVIDQTVGDMSVQLGLPHPGGFRAMLDAAIDEHPEAEVLVKTHPDVAAGHKRGHFGRIAPESRVRLLTEPANPVALLEQVDAVYVVTSLMGFEALLVGKPVTCFGVPFYAGWGVTEDRAPVPRRSRRRTVEEIFAAAYILYSRYVDPETGERCEVERIVEHLALQREMVEANAGTSVCVGFSAWKRGFVPDFLRSPRGRTVFARSASGAERASRATDARIIVWAGEETDDLRRLAERRAWPLCRMEDGFLRSVGLGSDLYVPASLVVDSRGIYYDPTRPSDLELILEQGAFDDEERARAGRLRRMIVAHGISKYNVGSQRGAAPPVTAAGRRVVLVVGQVEDDASIRLGCPGIARNDELLRAAREANPDAHVVFKPHPDVVSGNRKGAVPPSQAQRYADQVIEEAPIGDCLAVADEVHVLTSLVGFEAMLRELPVVVHGQPFYAGWGLTQDRHPHPRRRRRLALDELVAGALIRYPRYVSCRTGRFTSPEVVVQQLRQDRLEHGSARIRRSWPARQGWKALNLVRGVLRAS